MSSRKNEKVQHEVLRGWKQGAETEGDVRKTVQEVVREDFPEKVTSFGRIKKEEGVESMSKGKKGLTVLEELEGSQCG